jgi:hypothetical protein
VWVSLAVTVASPVSPDRPGGHRPDPDPSFCEYVTVRTHVTLRTGIALRTLRTLRTLRPALRPTSPCGPASPVFGRSCLTSGSGRSGRSGRSARAVRTCGSSGTGGSCGAGGRAPPPRVSVARRASPDASAPHNPALQATAKVDVLVARGHDHPDSRPVARARAARPGTATRRRTPARAGSRESGGGSRWSCTQGARGGTAFARRAGGTVPDRVVRPVRGAVHPCHRRRTRDESTVDFSADLAQGVPPGPGGPVLPAVPGRSEGSAVRVRS